MLDFNELNHPLPATVLTAAAASGSIIDLRRYPVRHPGPAHLLCAAIARRWPGIAKENVLLTHGSDDALKLLVDKHVHRGDGVALVEPCYMHVKTWIQLNGGVVASLPMLCFRALVGRALPMGTKLLYLCSPNNPTGATIRLVDLEQVLQQHADVAVVVDEAYGDYDDDCQSAAMLVPKYRNLFVVRTFSKLYGLAALRLGYLVAQDASELALWYNPKSVTQHAIGCGIAALSAQPAYDAIVQEVKHDLGNVCNILRAAGCPKVYAGAAPFVTFEPPSGHNAEDLLVAMQAEGYLLRNQSGRPMVENCIRMSMAPLRVVSGCIAALCKAMPQVCSPPRLLVLAAGLGSRMGSPWPKALCTVQGETLLAHTLRQFGGAVSDTLIVTGFEHGQIDAAVAGYQSVGTVYNQHFADKNNWYSMLVGLEELGDTSDIVMLDGDLWLADELASQLLWCKQSHMLADDYAEPKDEAMQLATDEDGVVIECSKECSGGAEYTGALRLQREDIAATLAILRACDVPSSYYDGLVGEQLPMRLLSTMGHPWIEVDNQTDLELAQRVATTREEDEANISPLSKKSDCTLTDLGK